MLWTNALIVAPNSPTALLGLAAEHHAEGRSAEAAELATRALSLRPTDARGHVAAARCLAASGQLEQAEGHAREAVRLGTPGGQAEIALAEVLTARGQPDQAGHLLDAAASRVGTDLGNLNRLGIALSRAGRTEQAVDVLERALQLAPNHVSTRQNLAAALFNGQQFERAADMFAGLAGQNPDEARWSLYRGQSLAGLERYAEAAAAYVRALELAPDDPQVLTAYSWLLSACPDPALHDGDKSLSLAERACEVTERSDPRALDCWAAALARCGRFDEAVAAADRAQGLAHDHGWTALAEQIKQRKLDYQAARPLDRLPEVRSD